MTGDGPRQGGGRPRPPGSRRRRALVRLAVFALLAAGGLVGAVLALLSDRSAQAVGVPLAVSALAGGAALVTVVKHLLPSAGGEDEEERHAPGVSDPDEVTGRLPPTRRALVIGGAAVAGAAAAVPLAQLSGRTTPVLRQTAWRVGSRVVTAEGRPVRVGDLDVGGVFTCWPEDAVGDADSQVVLVRVEPGQLRLPAERADWAPQGHVAYSKLCTHMGCPVGLYQTGQEILLCPCHQAAFDVLRAAQPVSGPAPRPLPQLPLAIGPGDALVARGDFHEAVGAGFWTRPQP